MQKCLLRGKIHRGTITEDNVDYEGSITIDARLMAAVDLIPFEQVHVWSVTTGERLVTYAIPGKAGSGEISMNGAAAHRIKKGEIVIITSFSWIGEKEARGYHPRIIFVDEQNRIKAIGNKLETENNIFQG